MLLSTGASAQKSLGLQGKDVLMIHLPTKGTVPRVLQILPLKTAVQRLHVYSMRDAHGVLIPCLAE